MNAFVNCLLVGAGGMIGAICRYLFSLLPIKLQNSFPINTLLINIIGAFCMGLIVAISKKDGDIGPQILLFLKIGICGGFTTFSTFSWEAMQLIQNGKFTVAISYMVLSTALCVSTIAIAQAIIK
ncbi:MAG TPA: fluoride efflux transporter CrcB [Anaerovoracaceae bacterium]|nr:fluoride efflux transporter CrcB [Anaerovoracaceae bacterium]